jgi:hypothetical protein
VVGQLKTKHQGFRIFIFLDETILLPVIARAIPPSARQCHDRTSNLTAVQKQSFGEIGAIIGGASELCDD